MGIGLGTSDLNYLQQQLAMQAYQQATMQNPYAAETARWDRLIAQSVLHNSPYLAAGSNKLLLLEEEC